MHHLRTACRSNEALERPLGGTEQAAMIGLAAAKLEELFDIFQIDHENDHNTRDTPRRVAKMFIAEMMQGRFEAPPEITDFENIECFDSLLVTGPLDVRSTCAHHLMPIYGKAIIGVLPSKDGRIIGLSKYDRIVEHFSSRLQIQEELVTQIGSYIFERTQPRGLAVRIKAVHMCKTHRGVRAGHGSQMVTTIYLGDFKKDPLLRQEFLRECSSLEKGC